MVSDIYDYLRGIKYVAFPTLFNHLTIFVSVLLCSLKHMLTLLTASITLMDGRESSYDMGHSTDH